MALDAGDLDLLRQTILETIDSAQEKIIQKVAHQIASAQEHLAQMVARQFVEMRADLQSVQDGVRKVGSRQAQAEADLAEVGRTCEILKRRLSDLHDDLGTGDRVILEREVSLRLDSLEREVADLRSRLSVV